MCACMQMTPLSAPHAPGILHMGTLSPSQPHSQPPFKTPRLAHQASEDELAPAGGRHMVLGSAEGSLNQACHTPFTMKPKQLMSGGRSMVRFGVCFVDSGKKYGVFSMPLPL